jgi:hypothetical protein
MGHTLARERGVPEWGGACGFVSVFMFCTCDSRPREMGKEVGDGGGVVTYVVWSLFTCAAGVVQA